MRARPFWCVELAVLATESLGVRGLCCLVRAGNRCILIDPGVALGYFRNGLLPHPCQVAIGDAVRDRIISAFSEATGIVISHYHGDHIPLADANPYQLPLDRVPPLEGAGLWCKGPSGISSRSLKRREDLIRHMDLDPVNAEQIEGADLCFSGPVPHGPPQSRLGTVMMTCIREEDYSFVHASDIQLLNREAVDRIIEWKPDIVIASGPPLYLQQISKRERAFAWKNAVELAGSAGTLILDHHLLRSYEGFRWLERLSAETGGNVISAADLMGMKTNILEAGREELYDEIPVPEGWHEGYARGETGFWDFVDTDLEKEMKQIRSQKTIDVGTLL